jgi:hypothetical protein
LLNDARYRTSVIAVKDSFYVVPIGVEDECGVVPGVIVRSQPGPSVVDPSRLDGCGVERINRFAVWRGERNVHRTGREGLQRPLVERATPCHVAYWQPHMIKQARWPTWHGSSIAH